MFKVLPSVKNYDWGQPGDASLVSGLSADGASNTTPFAEMWIGTHPSGPCPIIGSESQTLTNVVDSDKNFAGKLVPGGLPYLMKILSIAKPLSIQVHPDQTLAKELHAQTPSIYPDANHKPELSLAVSPFEAMCGFRSIRQVALLFTTLHESAALLSESTQALLAAALDAEPAVEDAAKLLKAVTSDLLLANPEVIKKSLEALAGRKADLLAGLKAGNEDDDVVKAAVSLMSRLGEYFPGDVGCWFACLLHHVTLQPGEAFFIPAATPHAYLFGDCVESMGCSDNVIRAGLTPKHKDAPLLISTLDYTAYGANAICMLEPKQFAAGGGVEYVPPVPEFKVVLQSATSTDQEFKISGGDVPVVGVVLQGDGQVIDPETGRVLDVTQGDCIALSASKTFNLKPAASPSGKGFRRVLFPNFEAPKVAADALPASQKVAETYASMIANSKHDHAASPHVLTVAWTLCKDSAPFTA